MGRHKGFGVWSKNKPVVGMQIQCTDGRKQEVIATIINVFPTGHLHIKRQSGKKTTISQRTLKDQWRPARVGPPQLPLPSVPNMSEADVRRIVREELKALFARISGEEKQSTTGNV